MTSKVGIEGRGKGGVGLVRTSGEGAHKAVSFRGRKFQVLRKRHTCSQDSRYDKCVNPMVG